MVYNFCEQCGIEGKALQYLAVFGANLAIIAEGMHFGWSSITFQITEDEASVLVAMLPLGTFIGSLCAEYTIDLVGRKYMILNSIIPLTMSWLLIALGSFQYFYYAARFLGGLVDGILFAAIPPYTAEISDPKIRGFLGSTGNVCIVLGMLVINVLYFFLNDSVVLIAYIATGLSLSSLLIVPFVPESPYFYVLKRDMVAAESSLKKFRGSNDVRGELNRIYEGIFNDEEPGENAGFCFMLQKYKKCLVISIGLTLVQHLSGITAIQSYCEKLFLGQQFLLPRVANVIYFLTYFLATMNSLFWVDFCGRKPLVLISISVSSIALFVNATYLLLKKLLNLHSTSLDSIEIVSILVFTSAYSIGLHTIPILVTSEIFPTNVKPKAHCIANVVYSVISTGVVLVFSLLSEHVGVYVPFYIFGINCLLGICFIVKYMPETKQKTLEDIQFDLKDLK